MSRVFVAAVYLETEPSEIAAPQGPGWYVDVRMNSGRTEIAPKIKITQGLANLLATAFEKATIKGQPYYNDQLLREDISITEAVTKATQLGREEVKAQLDQAEALAQQIAELRQTYGELGGEDEV